MSASLHPYDGKFSDEQRKKMFGDALKEMRTSRGLSKADVYNAIDVRAQTYDAYEKGESNPTLETLVRISYVLDCSIDMLTQRQNIYGDDDVQKAVIAEYAKQTQELLDNPKIMSNEAISKTLSQIGKFFELANKQLEKKPK